MRGALFYANLRAHMPHPFKTRTQWREMLTQTEEDGDRLTITTHMLERISGEEVTISVTARGKANIGFFIAGLQATAHMLNHKTSGEPMEGATFVAQGEVKLN